MPGLRKSDFDAKYRFRKSRKEGLVNCVSCNSRAGGISDEEPAFCEHDERFRRVKIAEYWKGFFRGTSRNLASYRVCDAYTSKPLPEGVIIPALPEKHAILLGTQFAYPYHADPNCPYVIEELRVKEGNKRAEIQIMDLSEMVPGESLRDICEMPCCESKLPFQIWSSDYRREVGIKPDGREPRIWVRNGIVKHEKKVEMTPEEAEAFFDLTTFNPRDFGSIHHRISAVSDYLEGCNRLGSRPLCEAVNPVQMDYNFHILKDSLVGVGSGADAWVYDERLFDYKKGLERPLRDLDKIPEGIIPCMDTKKIFRAAENSSSKMIGGRYSVSGILKPLENEVLLAKQLTHFLDIREVSFHASDHWWGEFGIGFLGLASFDEE